MKFVINFSFFFLLKEIIVEEAALTKNTVLL